MKERDILEDEVEEGKKKGEKVVKEVMVKMVRLKEEIDLVKERIDEVEKEVMREEGIKIEYMVGKMIEMKREEIREEEIEEYEELL